MEFHGYKVHAEHGATPQRNSFQLPDPRVVTYHARRVHTAIGETLRDFRFSACCSASILENLFSSTTIKLGVPEVSKSFQKTGRITTRTEL